MLRISEADTRAKLVNPLLTKASWNLKDRTQVDVEIPVDGYEKEPWNFVPLASLKLARLPAHSLLPSSLDLLCR